MDDDVVCEHGTAMDVHCCGDGRVGGCHRGFFPPENCRCYDVEDDAMDTRDGTIYDNRELAEAAGVPDEDLITGSREALEKLRKRLVFSGGSFKTAEEAEARKRIKDEIKK
jgi:hypothetical protein